MTNTHERLQTGSIDTTRGVIPGTGGWPDPSWVGDGILTTPPTYVGDPPTQLGPGYTPPTSVDEIGRYVMDNERYRKAFEEALRKAEKDAERRAAIARPKPVTPCPTPAPVSHSGAKYVRRIRGVGQSSGQIIEVDVYSVLSAFGVASAPVAHAVKKLLCAGQRGKGSQQQDLQEAIDALRRAIEELADESPCGAVSTDVGCVSG